MINYFAFQQTVTLCEDLLHDKLSYATNDRMVLMRRVLIKADEDFGSFLNWVSKNFGTFAFISECIGDFLVQINPPGCRG